MDLGYYCLTGSKKINSKHTTSGFFASLYASVQQSGETPTFVIIEESQRVVSYMHSEPSLRNAN